MKRQNYFRNHNQSSVCHRRRLKFNAQNTFLNTGHGARRSHANIAEDLNLFPYKHKGTPALLTPSEHTYTHTHAYTHIHSPSPDPLTKLGMLASLHNTSNQEVGQAKPRFNTQTA